MSIIKNKKILFALTFILVFVSFFYIKFPHERLKRRIVFEIERNTRFDAQIDKVKIIPLLKIEIKGLKLTKNDQEVIVPKAVFKPSILSLLSNDIDVGFDLKVFSGKAFGDLTVSKDSNQLKTILINIEKVDVDKIRTIYSKSAKENVELSGLLNGSLNLRADNTGGFDFYIEDLDVLKLSVNNFTLPEFIDLRSNLKGQIYRDKTIINELKLDNSEISLKLKGSTPPLWRLSKGSIDLLYRLEVKGKKYAYLKSILSKDKRGNVEGKIVGSIKNPQLKKANDRRAKPRRQQGGGPQYRKTFSPKKQHAI
ncbi:MAG: type II secretion system protein GspN [Candidatus Dadabacteria bacterium]|nr:type II secretion system protein GspN [Candidatus Dadabacteria bacterium]NIS07953.1 type II secretion system protein GspN [Candidatus Dadabacteria bacterium]NIV43046.1 type II secretion system protein GspN [Candidatus Dadabacteria bacterium]NIX14909.1 type II secretion system protein GspN [Candidatus Dadabacteria bacterium]NIY21537.1 type II secretion system protein GspN [Candidatus Dadabacteria bacterium]